VRDLSRRLGRLAAVATAALIVGAVAPVPAVAAQAAAPKVAIIVGPAGTAITARYRKAADDAAAVAQKLTPNVVRVYSPNATWPAVREAVTGASVVVYLGHGNGWPSPYSSSLRAKTMDGFGLNPVAGVDDVAHQYFGEAYVSRLRLAPGAVVLLSHLCYASGSSEPGMDDGAFSDVLSRVDNFAAGFIAAGASAVVAEGHKDPAALIAAAIRGPATMTKAWTSAKWGHGNIASYASARTSDAVVSLDPDAESGGFYRSLVRGSGGAGLVPGLVSGSAGAGLPAAPPSLATAGARFGTAVVANAVAPGASTSVQLPVTAAAASVPASLLVGVRWLPLVASSADPGSASTDNGLVVGEASADVVETATARRSGGALEVSVPTPKAPGTYVVLMTLEADDGTPYDVATQALLRPFTVVVPKPVDLRITAPASIEAQPGAPVSLTVTLDNTGTQAWGSSLYQSMWADPSLSPVLDVEFSSVLALTASWLDVATGSAAPAAAYPLPRALGAPGGTATVNLGVLAPAAPGQYLLVLSLAVHGTLGEFPQEPLLIPAGIGADAPAPSSPPPNSPAPDTGASPSSSAPASGASPTPAPTMAPTATPLRSQSATLPPTNALPTPRIREP
jgi:hypothetical protein